MCFHIDALQDPLGAIEMAAMFGTPSAVFIDIGGNRQEAAVLRLLDWVFRYLKSPPLRLVVVKSQELYAALKDRCDEMGVVQDADAWFRERLSAAWKVTIPKHPLQAPKKEFEGTLICRYHNYHRAGCRLHQDPATHCPYDHDHCHFCLQTGHVALHCPVTHMEE
jgi:hypothetical protein